MQAFGNVLTVLGIMLLTFILTVTLIGGLRLSRAQQTMYSDFRATLANGAAPVSQLDVNGNFVTLGTPVAIINFDRLHKQFVVSEGTTSNVLMNGPGHRRDTVMPGQAGYSAIFGRRAAYGGPFSVLPQLRIGDTITTTTGQGIAKYRVTSVLVANHKPKISSAAGVLELVTANGNAYMPSGLLVAYADLVTPAKPSDNTHISYVNLLPAERAMQGQSSNWVAVLLLSQALLLATVGIVWLYFRQGRLVAWLLGLPLLLALGVALSNQLAGLLPNLM